jgi:hypothetical protein
MDLDLVIISYVPEARTAHPPVCLRHPLNVIGPQVKMATSING